MAERSHSVSAGVAADAAAVAREPNAVSRRALEAWAQESRATIGAIDGLALSEPQLAAIAHRILSPRADHLRRAMAAAGFGCPDAR